MKNDVGIKCKEQTARGVTVGKNVMISTKCSNMSVAIECNQELIAGSQGSWKMRISPSQTIKQPGIIKIGYDLRCGIPYEAHCQNDKPKGTNYVTCEVPPGVKVGINGYDVHHSTGFESLEQRIDSESYRWRDLIGFEVNLNMQICKIKIMEGSIKPSDTFIINFGDTSLGSLGMQLPLHSMESWVFWVVSQENSNAPLKFIGKAILNIKPAEPKQIIAIAPSLCYVEKGQEFSLSCQVFDQGHNPVPGISDFSVSLPDGIKKKGANRFKAVAPGTYRLEVRSKSNKPLVARTNPISCLTTDSKYRLFWGEIHGHTNYSDGGSQGADQYYKWARDIARLDFSAITDHDFGIALPNRNQRWSELLEANEKYNQEGQFVTFPGYEISHAGILADTIYGHKNIYFANSNPPFYNSSPYGAHRVKVDYQRMEELWELLEGERFIVIDHHPAFPGGPGGMGTDWGRFNPKFERLVEIYSFWGSSETESSPISVNNPQKDRTVQAALAQGYRLGFTGGTDTHNARPGTFNKFGFAQHIPGLVGVWAEELTRESIFQALWDRKCYATRGARIILDFKINGKMMGAEIPRDQIDRSPVVNIICSGTAPFRIELLRNNKILTEWDEGKEDMKIQFRDNTFEQCYEKNKLIWYYVRITQTDGGMAWSSPIWISNMEMRLPLKDMSR